MGAEKVVLLLSYPSDEVGNHLVSLDQLDEAGIDPWHDVLSLAQFRAAFGEVVHPFTGVDYVAYYKSIIEDKEFADLSGEELKNAISEKIKAKDAKKALVGNMVSEGTTPRNLTDLIGSLCDLTSGSGDKGTPIIYIQGYFDNYTNE